MSLNNYLKQRRAELIEKIAAEELSGNEYKKNCTQAALAELDIVETVIEKECYFKMTVSGSVLTTESNKMTFPDAFLRLLMLVIKKSLNNTETVSPQLIKGDIECPNASEENSNAAWERLGKMNRLKSEIAAKNAELLLLKGD